MLFSQSTLTPEKLWSLGRVGFQGISKDGNTVCYSVSTADMAENKSKTSFYEIPLRGGNPVSITEIPKDNEVATDGDVTNELVSASGTKIIFSKEVKLQPIKGVEHYPSLSKSNVQIYDNLNQRHWDTWEDGSYSHLFVADVVGGRVVNEKDIMPNELFDCPQKPFGGAEDFLFSPDENKVLYVCKKKHGKEYAISTNTDIYCYDLNTTQTSNLTQGMEGYDTNPVFSPDGTQLAWLSMRTEGFESDKNELWIMNWATKEKKCLTENWDETVESFRWSNDNSIIYFVAPTRGTVQLFQVGVQNKNVVQLTKGQFDITGIGAQQGDLLVLSRTDMNRAAELYTFDISSKMLNQLTHVNDEAYKDIATCNVKGRFTEVENGDSVFSWVIYPPNFDPNKKYPLLLYCQGGPQGALSQFYSFRWNFQLMASQGYIVIAPNRTGMPGWGTEWNAAISKDWGGDPMRDYLAVVDDISDESYIDKDRRGAVGASYGGYSVFMLAGIHENRFKTFISHCGLFDLQSWYGTTEELWFANWDIGGAYWDTDNKAAQKSYEKFSPSNYVEKWNTPILVIQGAKDFRVPIEQGMQAFQAAQLLGLKSKFLLFPEENHWILKPQNGLVWQYEFFKWLKETL